jgi:IS4 transposase
MGLDEFLRGVRGPVFDKTIRVGAGRGYTTRLVAMRVPEEVAAERRRKLNEEARKRRKTPGALRLALAGWTVFVTNIPPETAGPEELRKLYGLRWHVELVFKALKGNGCLRALAAHASNRYHLEVLLLAQLLQLVLNLRVWRMLSPPMNGSPRLSLLKMAALARETLAALWPESPGSERWKKHMGTLLYRCRYDQRKKREHLDEIWESGLG